MTRDLGIPTLLERPDILSSAALCAELGFGFVELNANLPQFADPDAVDRRALELAAEAEMPLVNLHLSLGVYFTLPQGRAYLYEREGARFLAGLEALRSLAEREAPAGLAVCVENTGGFPAFAREGLERLLESPRFGLTLDVGHLCAAGNADADFFAAHADRLRHMHLHDCRGGQDHLPLGAGALDWRGALALARARGVRAVVEVKTEAALRASARALREL